jgi:hypothetical protein
MSVIETEGSAISEMGSFCLLLNHLSSLDIPVFFKLLLQAVADPERMAFFLSS